MDFVAVVLYLAAYYVRPQEWSWVLSSLHPITLIMAVGVAALFLRERGLPLRSLLRSPQDWLMLLYFLYLTFFVEADDESYKMVRNHFIIYFVTVQALTNLDRLRYYLYWWAACIGFVVLLALASQIGIDPLGASYHTTYVAKGRLCLPLSVFDNPNALGHSVVPLLAMLYFFLIWRRPVFIKEVGALALILPLVCLYLTLSKGAFLAGFVAVVAGLTVGRPKLVQLAVLAVALTAGWAGVKQLPRMEELRVPRREEGIQGRLHAWKFGLEKINNERYGVGIFMFGKSFEKQNGYYKAPHSSYVEAGAEQGFIGLMFFVGVLYATLRTLLTAKITDPEEERLRRVLVVLLVSFAASSWMIGWAYKTFFYLIAACGSAYYRHLQERVLQETEAAAAQEDAKALLPAPVPLLGAVGAPAGAAAALRTGTGLESLALAPAPAAPAGAAEDKPRPKFWYHLGLLDVALIWLGTHAVIRIWAYVVQHV